MTKTKVFLPCVLILVGLIGAPLAHAGGGKRITPEQFKATCDELASKGFSEPRTVNWTKITRDAGKHDLVMPVNFFAYNQKGGFFHGDFDEGDVNRYLEQLRDVYHGCGIDVELHTMKFPEGPGFLDNLARNSENLEMLGERERCLFRPLQVPGEVNVYFVSVVGSKLSLGVSHSWPASYLLPSEEGDSRYVGATVVTDYDRGSFGKSHDFVVPHEVGHVVFDMGHTMDNKLNLMADSAELLSYYVTSEQCDRALRSPLLRMRSQLDYKFQASGKVYRRGD